MVGLQYEGATEGISDNQFKYISEVLEKKGLSDKNVLIEIVGAAGDNYMANVKRIIAKDKDGKLLKIVAKIAPKHAPIRSLFNTHRMFNNEHIIYTEVLPKFKELQKYANVTKADMLNFAQCYGTFIEESDEMILLEDLNEKECVILDRLKPIEEKFLLDILKKLAIFHSLSFVLKHKNPEIFHDLSVRLYGHWSNMDIHEQVKVHLGKLQEYVLTLLSDDEEKSSIVRSVLIELSTNIARLAKEDAAAKHTVIQHGDAWTNNFMFILEGDKLIESIMIDYQASSESSPVTDILFSILNCTDHQMRLKRFNNWIEHYHAELDKALSYFGLEARNIYPKGQLDADLKRYGRTMCGLCIFFAEIISRDSEDAAKVKDSLNNDDDSNDLPQNNAAGLKARTEDIVDSCLAFGLI